MTDVNWYATSASMEPNLTSIYHVWYLHSRDKALKPTLSTLAWLIAGRSAIGPFSVPSSMTWSIGILWDPRGLIWSRLPAKPGRISCPPVVWWWSSTFSRRARRLGRSYSGGRTWSPQDVGWMWWTYRCHMVSLSYWRIGLKIRKDCRLNNLQDSWMNMNSKNVFRNNCYYRPHPHCCISISRASDVSTRMHWRPIDQPCFFHPNDQLQLRAAASQQHLLNWSQLSLLQE